MIWKRKLLSNSNLYLILDAAVADYDRLVSVTKEACKGGVGLFQLRDKTGCVRDTLAMAKKLRKIIPSKKAVFIVNDRIDVAMAAGADGVHLGQEDVPLPAARAVAPKGMLIGISCQTLAHVREANRRGADYIGFGSIFKTLTKPDRSPMDFKLLVDAIGLAKIPLFPIGGITQQNIAQLTASGVNRAAVCRDICLAQDIGRTIGLLKQELRG